MVKKDVQGILSAIFFNRGFVNSDVNIKKLFEFKVRSIWDAICRRKKIKQDRNLRLYQNGEKKYMQALDMVNLLKSVRLSKVLYDSMLTTRQKVLMSFQRDQMVESGTMSDASDYQ